MFFCSSKRRRLELGMVIVLFLCFRVKAKCSSGCNLAMASYFLIQGSNLTYISDIFGKNISEILTYNIPNVKNQDSIQFGTRVNIPFACDCLNDDFLGHTFNYTTQPEDTYKIIAQKIFANLTTADWIQSINHFDPYLLQPYTSINVTVNCSCGDESVSKDYGLFMTYPLHPEDNLSFVASESGVPRNLLQMYNPGMDFSQGSGLVFIPAKAGISRGAIAGTSVRVLAVAVYLMAILSYLELSRRKVNKLSLLPDLCTDSATPPADPLSIKKVVLDRWCRNTPGLNGISMDKSVEFSYDELAKATNDFSSSKKIGQGGFGTVYYGRLRGEKAAIKKMDMQASKELLAELNVHLIGYCVEGSLFLVYEFIENGNLSEHLHGSGWEPLPWTTRVQIALDSARGLEYIHEHTVPVYIHRDIKSANILIDGNYYGKNPSLILASVSDFGLTKLTEVGNSSLQTRLDGTFGYMPPKYAQYGDISPKIDVYAFGVVIFELILAKEAVVKENGCIAESRGLVTLFEDVLNQIDPKDDLANLATLNLGKIIHLIQACTQENPQLRPSMRSIVVALTTLSSHLMIGMSDPSMKIKL
ncbi:hypothetical protein MKW94_010725 [Papaver nudicaule]|uniref:Uncharacterized protein n=1 Tax=Papaver nudicaule TaxID=74823 RepID=A0AA42AWA2_PAPNU|nr:hypothetical protein [Papaver nudicaule]